MGMCSGFERKQIQDDDDDDDDDGDNNNKWQRFLFVQGTQIVKLFSRNADTKTQARSACRANDVLFRNMVKFMRATYGFHTASLQTVRSPPPPSPQPTTCD